MPRYGRTSMMKYSKRGAYGKRNSSNGSYKGISAGYKRPRSTGAFNAKVKKANLSSSEMKNYSMCIMEEKLYHNTWHKGGAKTLTATGTKLDGNDMVDSNSGEELVHSFENILTRIRPGVTNHTRLGNDVFFDRMKLRLFLANDVASPSITYCIVVYMTPNSLPCSTGKPTLLDQNIVAQGFNNLLRSVDVRSNTVLFEKLITPGKNGVQGNSGQICSQIEEINVRLKKQVTFQSPGHAYGARGGWCNLHVAILAYDGKYARTDADASKVVAADTECLAMKGTQTTYVSNVAVANLGAEMTLYFKETC